MQLANRKIKVCFLILNIFFLELAIKQPYPYPVLGEHLVLKLE